MSKEKKSPAAGVCSSCGEHFLLLAKHKCPVAALLTLDAASLLQNALENLPGKECDACGQRHLVTCNVNPFRIWKNCTFCADCYRIEEIQREITLVRDRMRRRDIELGNTTCCLCSKRVIDVTTERDLCAYERDHVDVFSKRDGVGVMCQRGDDWSSVCREADQCRILCKRCHSIVTFAQRQTGLLRLKKYNAVSQQTIESAKAVTDQLTALLLQHLTGK
jgi:hypothetical protein